MEKRKNLNKDLRRQSGLFFQIGLLIALMICVSAFQYTSKEDYKPVEFNSGDEGDDWMPPVTIIPPPEPPKPKVVPNIIEAVEDDPEPIDAQVTFDMPEIGEIELPKVEDGPKDEKAESVPFDIVEEMPKPDGGYESFYKFIKKNLKYPPQAKRMIVEGKVFVKFVVLENGELSQIHIAKGIGAGCDEEVLRVMKKAPRWNPGKQRGKAVKVWQIVPINFQLN